jgi:hypothetical protein
VISAAEIQVSDKLSFGHVTRKSFTRLPVASPNGDSQQLADEAVNHNRLDSVM